jgi:site-specific recombinase XerD
VTDAQIEQLLEDLEAQGWEDTAALVRLMRDTGLRVEVEALRGNWEAQGGRLVVKAGKGGHGRVVPYEGPEVGALQGLTYEGHLRRIKATGSPIRPHDLRRAFVKRVYERSGKDIRVAQVLAGHADPGTTAGYIGVDWDELSRATQA